MLGALNSEIKDPTVQASANPIRKTTAQTLAVISYIVLVLIAITIFFLNQAPGAAWGYLVFGILALVAIAVIVFFVLVFAAILLAGYGFLKAVVLTLLAFSTVFFLYGTGQIDIFFNPLIIILTLIVYAFLLKRFFFSGQSNDAITNITDQNSQISLKKRFSVVILTVVIVSTLLFIGLILLLS